MGQDVALIDLNEGDDSISRQNNDDKFVVKNDSFDSNGAPNEGGLDKVASKYFGDEECYLLIRGK
jgi:hypothetical protein